MAPLKLIVIVLFIFGFCSLALFSLSLLDPEPVLVRTSIPLPTARHRPPSTHLPIAPRTAESRNHSDTIDLQRLGSALAKLEQSLPPDVVGNFKFQQHAPRSTALRPHHVSYLESLAHFPLPVPDACPSSIRPDEFCAPNCGRDWTAVSTVFPISYSLPEELFPTTVPKKDKDCSSIVPRDKATYSFSTQEAYVNEYARSYYCITYKKGGWDVLRHYEIVAAGCMPYIVDLEYSPVYTLYHLPKRLLLEARDLPGVTFDCAAVRVQIDHTVFPLETYMRLMQELLTHAHVHMTTKAMAKYVLNVSGFPQAKKVLYLSAGKKGVMLKAQGNYNSWTLFHGLRTLLGKGVVDPFPISFLYNQPKEVMNMEKRQLYGFGFGYAYKLKHESIDREDIVSRIKRRDFDLVIFADPTAMAAVKSKTLKYLRLVQTYYSKSEILFLHAPDIAYPAPSTVGYDITTLYKEGIVFQREIMDCEYYAPPNRKSETMKRCVWYHNQNCFDDVNVHLTMERKRLKEYPWKWPVIKAGNWRERV